MWAVRPLVKPFAEPTPSSSSTGRTPVSHLWEAITRVRACGRPENKCANAGGWKRRGGAGVYAPMCMGRDRDRTPKKRTISGEDRGAGAGQRARLA